MSIAKLALVSVCTLALLAGVVVGWYGPMAGDDAALLQIPTVVLLAAFIAGACRGWIESTGFALAMLFLGLHTVAAYYGYNNVPYDDWTESLVGFRFDAWLESDRNHYDRLMHLLYGLFLLLPVRQAAMRLLGVGRFAATWVAVEFLLASSLLYEVAEWLIAVFMAPDIAERYNGQQGDVWDAQTDMALAACGAVFAAAIAVMASMSTRGSGESPGPTARGAP